MKFYSNLFAGLAIGVAYLVGVASLSAQTAQTAVYNSTLLAPGCATVGISCDSGPSLLLGRGKMSGGAEPNQPNTINNSCADGQSGTFHSAESNDRIVVASTNGGALTAGNTVTVTATVWTYATSGSSKDSLDIYYAANANSPSWVLVKTIAPTTTGASTLSTTYTLPTGSLQAVRANFRSGGSAAVCTTGSYDDHDDLIFAVASAGTPSFSLSATAASVKDGSTGTSTVTESIANGFNSPVTLSASGLPTGVTAAFSPTSITGAGTSTLTFTASSTATPGTYTVTVTGTPTSGTTETTTLTLTVSAAAAPLAQFSATSMSFPNVAVGTTSAATSVTLTNGGTATLNITSIVLGGTNASDFAETTTCGSTLAANASCTITATFTPAAASSYSATITVTDNASGSPQTISLSGTGVSTAPKATLSATSISFPNTAAGTTSAASSVTLSNGGTATLNITSIVLGGTNASDFDETTTCGATLAINASCTISATFTPAAASNYGATITVTDNASGSPQTITLSGTGTASTITHTLYVFPEADNTVTPLYALVNNAKSTIDMTMYALEDTTFSGDLVSACNRGVKVRVILDVNNEKSGNTAAFNQLNGTTNCSAVWANTAFSATHQKTITIDDATVAIMSLNLQSQYYSTTRDYALVSNDPNDIAAVEATFNEDYAAGTTNSGTSGASDFSYAPGAGDDLIWSPTTATTDLLAIINNAKSTMLVENEEMSASNIVSALESACKRGVTVHIAMVNSSSYASEFSALVSAGCGVNTYPDSGNGLYIHAKAILADYGLSTQSVYMGSINFSTASMTENRELGLYISDSASVTSLYNTITADYAGGTAY